MQNIIVKTNNNILASSAVSILKGAQEWLRIAPTGGEAVEQTRNELIQTLGDLRYERNRLTENREETIMALACAEVQIHLALEQKKVLDAAIAQILGRKTTEKNASVLKSLEAAYWRTMVSRRKLLKEIDVLFADKRQQKKELSKVDFLLMRNNFMRRSINEILDNPNLLLQASQEPIAAAA